METQKEQDLKHPIMNKPLPQILDELQTAILRAEQAAQKAEDHSDEAKDYADKAKEAASREVKEAIQALFPDILNAQATADKALQIGNLANKNATQALDYTADIYEKLRILRSDFGDFAVAVVNGLADFGKGIVDSTKFLKMKAPEEKK